MMKLSQLAMVRICREIPALVIVVFFFFFFFFFLIHSFHSRVTAAHLLLCCDMLRYAVLRLR